MAEFLAETLEQELDSGIKELVNKETNDCFCRIASCPDCLELQQTLH